MPPGNIKVLYVLPSLEIGGMEKHVLSLVQALDRNAFTPSVLVLQRNGPLEPLFIQAGVTPSHLSMARPYRLSTVFALRKVFRREKPDIVHTYLCGFDVLVGLALVGMRRKTRLVFSRREMAFWRGKRHWRLERLGNLFADRIVACSEAVRSRMLVMEKLDDGKIKTIYNGVKAGDGQSNRTAGHGPVKVLGMVSNFSMEKDQCNVLKAFHALQSDHADLKLIFTGDGKYLQKVKDLARDLDLSSKVVFAGPTLNVQKTLNEMDLFVFASKAEGLPNVILEAFAAGVPVVATAVGGVPEIVRHEQTGLLVAPERPEELAAALHRMINDEKLRENVARNARNLAQERFSLKGMAAAYHDLYTTLLNQVAS